MNNEEEKNLPQLVKSGDGTMRVSDEGQTQAVTQHNKDDLIPDARNLFQLAEGLARSSMFPNIQNKYEALAVIQYGNELHIPPVTALQTIIPVKGNLSMRAHLMQALLERNGVKITILEKTPEICRLRFEKKNKDPFEETFTHEDAKRVKNRNTGKTLADGDNYQNYPEEMNYCRCLTKGGRVYDPAAWLGLYSFEEMNLDAGPYQEAKAYDKKVAEHKKEKEKAAAAPPKEEKEPEPKKKAGRPKTKEKPKEEGSVQGAATSEEAEKAVEPGKGDPSKLTPEERIEIVKANIMEDFALRYGTQHKKENPDMKLADYVKEKYRRFKLFLKWFQEEKNVKEGKKLCFVAIEEHGYLSLGEGSADHVEQMWEHKKFTLDNFFEWEKLPPEEEDDQDPPF